MKRTIITLTLLTFFISGMAQITFGPRLGFNMSKYSYNWSDDWDEPQVKFRGGFTLGGMMNWQINDFLAFQPGLMITKKGTAHDVDSWNSGQFVYTGHDRDRITYFEVPLNLAGGIRLGAGQIQLFVGPYIAYAIAGKNVYNYEENDNGVRTDFKGSKKIEFKNKIEEGDHANDDVAYYQRPFDWGLNFGLGYRYNQYLFNIGYSLGLANLQPEVYVQGVEASNDFKYTNNTIFITAAWLFGDQ
jgi:hypothetical protein